MPKTTNGLGDLIDRDAILFDVAAANKRGVVEALGRQAAILARVDTDVVTTVILDREALGSTGFGAGTAIPHGRLPGLARIIVVAAKLARPIDFAALDGLPVDLVVLMLAPGTGGADHLKALARVSRALRDTGFCARLRAATTADAFYAILVEQPQSAAA